jgi:hypothetical protein
MPIGCTRREDWPSPLFARGCMCTRCRRDTIDQLADRSLSAALAHSQNRVEQGSPERLGDELTIDRDISVIWSPRRNLQTWRKAPVGRPGDTPPNRPSQWLYRFFLGSSPKPVYIGRVTGRSLVARIDEHLRRGRTIANLTPSKVRSEIAANNALLRSGSPLARTEDRMIDAILASLPASAFQFSFAEVKRLSRGTRARRRAFGADTALAEKHYHRRNAAWINRRDNPRFETASGPRCDDPSLARLVRRVSAAIATWAGTSRHDTGSTL